MSFIAVIGAGPLGGAVAHALARRDRVGRVRLIDPDVAIAQGKALDIMQSAPVDGFRVVVEAAAAPHDAAGADVVVLADGAADGKEHRDEAGLAMLRRLVRAAGESTILCAGAGQRELIGRSVTELHVHRSRVVGSAPLALESALRALAGIALDGAATEVSVRLVGVPPRATVVAWEEATANGQPLRTRLAPHLIAALEARLPGLWPPGPYSLGAAAARIAEALAHGSRRQHTCFVTVDAGPVRAAVAAMPVQFGKGAIERVLEPSLTPQERTMLENALEGERAEGRR